MGKLIQILPHTGSFKVSLRRFTPFFKRSSSGTWFFLSLDETEEDFKNLRGTSRCGIPETWQKHLYVVKSDYYSAFLMGTRVRSKTSLDDERSFVQRQIKVCDRYLTRILSPHFKTYKQITHAIKDYNTEDNYRFDGCFPQTIFNGMIVASKPIWKPL